MREERRAALEAQSHPELTGPEEHGGREEAEAPGYQDQFTGQQPVYEQGQGGYQDQQTGGYDQQAYADQQQTPYQDQQQTYDEQYFAPNGGLPQGEGYPAAAASRTRVRGTGPQRPPVGRLRRSGGLLGLRAAAPPGRLAAAGRLSERLSGPVPLRGT